MSIEEALRTEALRIETLVREQPGLPVPDELTEEAVTEHGVTRRVNVFLVVADSLRRVAAATGEPE